MKGIRIKQQPGMTRAAGRKRHNRALREEKFAGEALQLGITVREHKQNQFEEVQELRKHPPLTPDWMNPWAVRK